MSTIQTIKSTKIIKVIEKFKQLNFKIDRPIIKFSLDSRKISSLAFSPEDDLLTTATFCNVIVIFGTNPKLEREYGKELSRINSHSSVITSIVFSPCGNYLVSGSNDLKVLIHKVYRKNNNLNVDKIFEIQDHLKVITSICFSNSGNYFASTSFDLRTILYDVKTKNKNDNLEKYNKVINNKDNNSVNNDTEVITKKNELKDELKNNNEISFIKRLEFQDHKHWVHCLKFSPNEDLIATSSADWTIFVYCIDITNKNYSFPLVRLFGHKRPVSSIDFFPFGDYLVSASTLLLFHNINPKHKDVFGTEIMSINNHKLWINCVNVSKDGKFISTAGEDKLILLYKIDIKSMQVTQIKKLDYHNHSFSSVVFSNRGYLLAAGTEDSTIFVYC